MIFSKIFILFVIYAYADAIIQIPFETRFLKSHPFRNKRQTIIPLTYNEPYSVGQVQIGTPPQTFSVILDTGSGDLFIPSAETCTSNDCLQQHRFECNQSSTCQATNQSFQSGFGDHGTIDYDLVCLGSQPQICTTNHQAFGLVSRTAGWGVDGLLGLSYDWLTQGHETAVMLQIFQSKQCPEKVFAFWLNSTLSASDGERHGGLFTICGTDPTHYINPIMYVPVVTTGGWWTVSMDSFTIGTYTFGGPFQTIVDSGAPNGFGIASDAYPKVMAQLGADSNGQIDCAQIPFLPIITVTFNGINFTLDPSIYIMPFNDQNQQKCSVGLANSGSQYWLIGVMFQRKYYSIFDFGNSRIGFALSQPPLCVDQITDCNVYTNLCSLPNYKSMMCRDCQKSCGLCGQC